MDFRDILRSPAIDADWLGAAQRIELPLAGFVAAGSCNPGDRRALFYLTRYLKPQRVLELGSNIGGSTLAIAVALRMNMDDGGTQSTLTTVDKADVNAIWNNAPRDHVAAAGMAENVSFVVSDSRAYLDTGADLFDFLFIDADHDEPAVYRDISGAIKRIDQDGLIVLHDYFPNAQPLWSDGRSSPARTKRSNGCNVRA